MPQNLWNVELKLRNNGSTCAIYRCVLICFSLFTLLNYVVATINILGTKTPLCLTKEGNILEKYLKISIECLRTINDNVVKSPLPISAWCVYTIKIELSKIFLQFEILKRKRCTNLSQPTNRIRREIDRLDRAYLLKTCRNVRSRAAKCMAENGWYFE